MILPANVSDVGVWNKLVQHVQGFPHNFSELQHSLHSLGYSRRLSGLPKNTVCSASDACSRSLSLSRLISCNSRQT